MLSRSQGIRRRFSSTSTSAADTTGVTGSSAFMGWRFFANARRLRTFSPREKRNDALSAVTSMSSLEMESVIRERSAFGTSCSKNTIANTPANTRANSVKAPYLTVFHRIPKNLRIASPHIARKRINKIGSPQESRTPLLRMRT